MKDGPGTRDYDWWLLAILAAICALGVIEIYSATHGSSLAGMHMKQVRWLVIGFILMFALSRLDYHLILDQAPVLYLIGLAALVAVLLIGRTHFGAKRWISIPALGELVQVSELVKLIIIIVLARFFAEVGTDQLDLRDLIKAGFLVGIPLVLILKQPDLGTALVLMPMLAVGAFLAGLKWQHAAVFSLAGIMVVGAVFYPPVSRHILKTYQLLSLKPMLIALSLDESQQSIMEEEVLRVAAAKAGLRTRVVAFFGKIDLEMSELSAGEARMFMDEYGIRESALDTLIREAYALLGLQSFLTVGEDECRAWAIRTGMTAQEAAGVIHSDFVAKFIRAEVVHYDDFIAAGGSFAKAKEAGHWRLEGKGYEVKDGDILNIRHG